MGSREGAKQDMSKIARSEKLPPRKLQHPSQKGKWTRIFFQILVLLFVLLIAGLIIMYKRYPAWFEG